MEKIHRHQFGGSTSIRIGFCPEPIGTMRRSCGKDLRSPPLFARSLDSPLSLGCSNSGSPNSAPMVPWLHRYDDLLLICLFPKTRGSLLTVLRSVGPRCHGWICGSLERSLREWSGVSRAVENCPRPHVGHNRVLTNRFLLEPIEQLTSLIFLCFTSSFQNCILQLPSAYGWRRPVQKGWATQELSCLPTGSLAWFTLPLSLVFSGYLNATAGAEPK